MHISLFSKLFTAHLCDIGQIIKPGVFRKQMNYLRGYMLK